MSSSRAPSSSSFCTSQSVPHGLWNTRSRIDILPLLFAEIVVQAAFTRPDRAVTGARGRVADLVDVGGGAAIARRRWNKSREGNLGASDAQSGDRVVTEVTRALILGAGRSSPEGQGHQEEPCL